MPRGARPGERRGGREKGTRNKATVERLERERIAEQIAAAAGHPGAGAAVAKAMETNRPLAKTELEDVIPILKSIMAHFMNPTIVAAKSGAPVSKAEWDHVRTWIELFVDVCTKLAPFQSPTYRAMLVSMTPGEAPARPGDDAKVIKMLNPVDVSREYQRIVRGKKAG